MSLNIQIIDTKEKQSDFLTVFTSVKEGSFIAIDTEFTRVRTYYPILDLIQVCIDEVSYLLDPHAINVDDFIKAFVESKASFILFSAREDLEILSYKASVIGCSKLLPDNIIDIQLLQAFLNLSYMQGLQSSIKDRLGIDIPKAETMSDWSLRPLTKSQQEYAAQDVIYLKDLYEKVMSLADDDDVRLSYFKQETIRLSKVYSTFDDEDTYYLTVSGAGALHKNELAMLKYLCKKRLVFAKRRNVALNRIITTKALCPISRLRKIDEKALLNANMKPGAVRQYGTMVIRWFNEAMEQIKSIKVEMPYDYFACDRDSSKLLKTLRHQLKVKAQDLKICEDLLGSKALCNDYFYSKENQQTPILETSWFKECVGEIKLN